MRSDIVFTMYNLSLLETFPFSNDFLTDLLNLGIVKLNMEVGCVKGSLLCFTVEEGAFWISDFILILLCIVTSANFE